MTMPNQEAFAVGSSQPQQHPTSPRKLVRNHSSARNVTTTTTKTFTIPPRLQGRMLNKSVSYRSVISYDDYSSSTSLTASSSCRSLSTTTGWEDVAPTTVTPTKSSTLKSALKTSSSSSSFPKSVRFLSTDEGKLRVKSHKTQLVLTPELLQSVWWTATDFRKFRNHSRQQAMTAETIFEDSFIPIFEACMDTTSLSSQRRSQQEEEHVQVLLSLQHERGLEHLAFPPKIDEKNRVIRHILHTQKRLSTTKKEASDRAAELASTARQLTRPSCQLAHWLGVSDARVVEAERAVGVRVQI